MFGLFKKKKIEQQLGSQDINQVITNISNYIREKEFCFVEELEPFWHFLNDTEKEQIINALKKKPFIEIKEDMIKYNNIEQESTIDEHDIFERIMKPDYIDTKPNYIQVGQKYMQGQTAIGFPNIVSDNYLSTLIKEKSDVDFTIFLKPNNVAEIEEYLVKEIKKVEADLINYPNGNISLEQRKNELETQLQHIIAGDYKLFRMHLYLLSKGEKPEEVLNLSKRVANSLRSEGIEVKNAVNYQQNLLKSMIPTGTNHLKDPGILAPGDAAAASFPFSSPFYEANPEKDIIYGWLESDVPLCKSIWTETSYSMGILGPTGRGKSFSVKAILEQEYRINGTRLLIIDPAAGVSNPEYSNFVKNLGGKQIDFDTKSTNFPNFLAIHGDDFQEEVSANVQILGVLLNGIKEGEGLTSAQVPIIEKALIHAYESKGILMNDRTTWKNEPPQLIDLYNSLRKFSYEYKSQEQQSSFDAILKRLERFIKGGLHSYVNNNKETFDVNSKLTYFCFKKISDDVKPALTALVMNYIKHVCLGHLEKTIIVLEEASIWLKIPELARFLEWLITKVRKANTGVMIILQDLGQLQNCTEGLTLLGNLYAVQLMGVKENMVPLTQETFNLNDEQMDYLINSGVGKGIIKWGTDVYKVTIDVDPDTWSRITTNPDEVNALTEERKKGRSEKLNEVFLRFLGHIPLDADDGINELLDKIKNNKNVREILDLMPIDERENLNKLLKDYREEQVSNEEMENQKEEIIQLWLKYGVDRVNKVNNPLFANPEVVRMADKDWWTIKKAMEFYKQHSFEIQPIGLNNHEKVIYERVRHQLLAKKGVYYDMFSTTFAKELDKTAKIRKQKKELEESESDENQDQENSNEENESEKEDETEIVKVAAKVSEKKKTKKHDSKNKHAKVESKKSVKIVKHKKEESKKDVSKHLSKSKVDKSVSKKDSKAFVHAKKELLENKEFLKSVGKGNVDTGEHLVAKLLEKKWYKIKDLSESEIKILTKAGYKKSGNEVYDINGKKAPVIGYLEGHESLQHLSFKYFFQEALKEYNPEMEHLCKNSHNEVDLVIEKNGEKIAIEFELNPDMDHKVLSKIVELETEFKMIFYCCRARDKKRFENLESSRLHIGNYSENLKKIQEYLKF